MSNEPLKWATHSHNHLPQKKNLIKGRFFGRFIMQHGLKFQIFYIKIKIKKIHVFSEII